MALISPHPQLAHCLAIFNGTQAFRSFASLQQPPLSPSAAPRTTSSPSLHKPHCCFPSVLAHWSRFSLPTSPMSSSPQSSASTRPRARSSSCASVLSRSCSCCLSCSCYTPLYPYSYPYPYHYPYTPTPTPIIPTPTPTQLTLTLTLTALTLTTDPALTLTSYLKTFFAEFAEIVKKARCCTALTCYCIIQPYHLPSRRYCKQHRNCSSC